MLEGVPGLIVYLALKFGGYSAWSYVGLRWFEPERDRFAWGALGRGVARLVIGWGTGILVAPFALAAVRTDQIPLFYFTVLVAIRWLEWGVVQLFFSSSPEGAGVIITGGSGRWRLWRVVGILVSYLADAPFLISGGFPHGRLFC